MSSFKSKGKGERAMAGIGYFSDRTRRISWRTRGVVSEAETSSKRATKG